MKITILTLFPEIFGGFMSESIIGRAIRDKKISTEVINLREWGLGKHQTVDDTPYGGGAGMVLKVDVVAKAIVDIKKRTKERDLKVILMTPQGQIFNQEMAKKISEGLVNGSFDLLLVCGHYEGFDERIRDYVDMEISIGDYILTGGELGAAVITDAITRLIPGVLGKEESHQKESFEGGLLEHDHYTRPEIFEGKRVPAILLSGNHAKIEEWRHKQSVKRTKKRRPDLLIDERAN